MDLSPVWVLEKPSKVLTPDPNATKRPLRAISPAHNTEAESVFLDNLHRYTSQKDKIYYSLSERKIKSIISKKEKKWRKTEAEKCP
jgi:NAD kinase